MEREAEGRIKGRKGVEREGNERIGKEEKRSKEREVEEYEGGGTKEGERRKWKKEVRENRWNRTRKKDNGKNRNRKWREEKRERRENGR